MTARRRPAPGAEHLFRLRGVTMAFRATRFVGAVRVEVISLDDTARNQAAAALSRALVTAGFEVFPLAPAPQCRRFEVYGADTDRVRAEFPLTVQALEGGAA